MECQLVMESSHANDQTRYFQHGEGVHVQEVDMAEWQVPASFSQTLASEGERALPARILDRFSFFTLSSDGIPQLQPLTALAEGVHPSRLPSHLRPHIP